MRLDSNLIVTEDGTNTLFSDRFNEAYHSSRDGALRESLEKHVKSAFKFQPQKEELVILDICFGLGYNTLSTLHYIKEHFPNTKAHIISPEMDRPLIESLASFKYPLEFEQFGGIIQKLSRDFYYESEQFKIEILLGDARDLIPKIETKFDIVYQDAFSPKQNPLLWTKEYFADIRNLSKDNTIITTYSIATPTRMGLYENGYNIYLYSGEGVRSSTIASLSKLELPHIDMELKQLRNPNAKSLRDKDYRIGIKK